MGYKIDSLADRAGNIPTGNKNPWPKPYINNLRCGKATHGHFKQNPNKRMVSLQWQLTWINNLFYFLQLWPGFMLSKDCDNAWLWELTMSFYIFLPTITFWTKLIYFAPLPLWSLWPVSSYGKMKQRGWEFKDWQDTPTICCSSSSHASWEVSCHWATSAPCHGE